MFGMKFPAIFWHFCIAHCHFCRYWMWRKNKRRGIKSCVSIGTNISKSTKDEIIHFLSRLVLDYISIVMMLVSEGGENSQMALIRYFFDLHKIIVVYGLDPKILLYGYFGAIKFFSQRFTSHDKNGVFPPNVRKSWGEPWWGAWRENEIMERNEGKGGWEWVVEGR